MDEQSTPSQPSSSGSSMGKIVGALVVVLLLVGIGYFAYQKLAVKPQVAQPQTTVQSEHTMAVSPTEAMQMTGTASGGTVPVVPVSASASGSAKAVAITVTASNFTFSPKAITVKKGQQVTINFVNSGGNHDFMIDEFNVKTPVIASGQTSTVTFTPDKTGTFFYYCSVANHRQMGMQGTLTVQ